MMIDLSAVEAEKIGRNPRLFHTAAGRSPSRLAAIGNGGLPEILAAEVTGRSWPTAAGISRFLNGGSSFWAAKSAPPIGEEERDLVRIQTPLMQIMADTVCLIGTQLQQVIGGTDRDTPL